MSNHKKHIDDFFREKLGNYRETPPPDAWGDIEARLDGLNPPPAGFSYRWLLHFAIISVILFFSVTVLRKMMSSSTGTDKTNALAMNNGQATDAASPVAGTTVTTATTPGGDNTPGNDNSGSTGSAPAGIQPQNTAAGSETQQTASRPGSTTQPTNTKHHYTQPQKAALNPFNGPSSHSNAKTAKPSSYSPTYNPSTFSSPIPNPSFDDETITNQTPNASPDKPLSSLEGSSSEKSPGSDKKEPGDKPKPAAKAPAQVASTPAQKAKAPKPTFTVWSAGVKTGLETGCSNEAANKFVISPYLQFNVSPKVSFMTQPAVKIADAPKRNIGNPQQYYKANPEDGHVTIAHDSSTTVGPNTYHYTTFRYTQPHDSIVKSYRTGGTAFEFELPVLVKYDITKKLAVYGGVNLVYRKATTINENTFTQKGITRSFDTTVFATSAATPDAPQGLGFTYAGSPVSSYGGPIKPAQSGYQLSAGYMVGFSYTASNKWLFDAAVQQSPAKTDIKGGYDINKPQSAPYFRLTVGYKLTK